MPRFVPICVLTCLAAVSAQAGPHRHPRIVCTPVAIEGVGTVRICAGPARGR